MVKMMLLRKELFVVDDLVGVEPIAAKKLLTIIVLL